MSKGDNIPCCQNHTYMGLKNSPDRNLISPNGVDREKGQRKPLTTQLAGGKTIHAIDTDPDLQVWDCYIYRESNHV